MKIEGAPETDRSEEGERKGERVWERIQTETWNIEVKEQWGFYTEQGVQAGPGWSRLSLSFLLLLRSPNGSPTNGPSWERREPRGTSCEPLHVAGWLRGRWGRGVIYLVSTDQPCLVWSV